MEYLEREDIILNRLKDRLSKIELGKRQIPLIGLETNEILFNFTMEMASGEISLDETKKWFEKNTEPIPKEGQVV